MALQVASLISFLVLFLILLCKGCGVSRSKKFAFLIFLSLLKVCPFIVIDTYYTMWGDIDYFSDTKVPNWVEIVNKMAIGLSLFIYHLLFTFYFRVTLMFSGMERGLDWGWNCWNKSMLWYLCYVVAAFVLAGLVTLLILDFEQVHKKEQEQIEAAI